jgi:phosphatidate cytidylyltransferase
VEVLRRRALGALVVVPPLVVAVLLGEPWIAILVTVVVGVAAMEALRLLRGAGYPTQLALGVALAVVVSLAIGVAFRPDVDPALAGAGVLLGAIGVILAAVGAFARPDPRDGLAAWMTTVFGALYVSQLGFVVRLGPVAPPVGSDAPLAMLDASQAWVVILVLGVWAYDTGAYLVGSRVGGPKFLTHISPSKTYAGLIGGLLAATVVVALGLWAVGAPVVHAVLLGPLLAIAAQAGDLAESVIKRAAGAKDSSNLIPGHGGILDRIDSFLFAAPAVTLYVLAFLG